MSQELKRIESLIEHLENYKSQLTNFTSVVDKLKKGAELHHQHILLSKSAAVVSSTVGTGLIVAGIVLNPVTLGVSNGLIVTGLGLGVAGNTASIVTLIDQNVLSKSREKKLQKYYEELQSTKIRFTEELNASQKLKEMLDALIDYIPHWIEAQYFKDERIHPIDIEVGDHIYRPIRIKINKIYMKIKLAYHHGVYLGEIKGDKIVVQFGQNGVNTTPLDTFIGNGRKVLFKRNYNGYCIPIEKTQKLAEDVLNVKTYWSEYHWLQNNCECFATYLKLKIPRSGQVDKAASFCNSAKKNILPAARVSDATIRAGSFVEAVSKLSTFTSKIRSIVVPFKNLGKFSQTAVVVAPIIAIVDIGMLVYDFNCNQPNIKSIEKMQDFAKQELQFCDQYSNGLKNYYLRI